MHDDHGHGTPEQTGYEVSDVQIRVILMAGVATVILTFLGYVVGTFATKYFRAQPSISDFRQTPVARQEAAKPWDLPTRLQVDPPRANKEFKAEQTAVATSYGVVSEKPEIYRIPVETAMKIVSEKGLPKFPKLADQPGPAQQ